MAATSIDAFRTGLAVMLIGGTIGILLILAY